VYNIGPVAPAGDVSGDNAFKQETKIRNAVIAKKQKTSTNTHMYILFGKLQNCSRYIIIIITEKLDHNWNFSFNSFLQ
jgi:hypothetical protein